jgi:hypothetical protein
MNALLAQAKLLPKSEQLQLASLLAENVALLNNEPQNGVLKQIATALIGAAGSQGAVGSAGSQGQQ